METRQTTFPVPSRWGINAGVAGRPLIGGSLIINSIDPNGRVTGSINFRGSAIPIQGHWNASTRQIRFHSPYANFEGRLSITDDATIRVRHFMLQGTLVMKPPSIHAGEHGTWIATATACITQPSPSAPQATGLPPVGAFVTADYTENPCR